MNPSGVAGKLGDLPVVGDWDGDGFVSEVGVFRRYTPAGSSVWLLDLNGDTVMQAEEDRNGDGRLNQGEDLDGGLLLDTGKVSDRIGPQCMGNRQQRVSGQRLHGNTRTADHPPGSLPG